MAKISILMQFLACDKTTEMGADEVYVLAVGRRSDGQTYSRRLPEDAPHEDRGHWDMNDGDQPTDNPDGDSHMISNKTLFTGDLEDGQTWSLVFMLMEEDGGTSKTEQEIGAAILAESGDPYAAAAGTILGVLTYLGIYLRDTDDYIGSFGIELRNQGGQITAAWRPIDRVNDHFSGETRNYDNQSYGFRMGGDGSNYYGLFKYQT